MQKVDLKRIFDEKAPGYMDRYPKLIANILIRILEKILNVREINKFLARADGKEGFEFIDELFDHLNFSYLISSLDQLKIPSEGRLICVVNHPLAGLDGLSVLRAIGRIRPDVKIIANDVLMNIDNLKSLFIPYNVFSKQKLQRDSRNLISEALLNEEAVIFFPAAEVSRMSLRGIYDRRWMNGSVYFSRGQETPILPIYVKGKNSYFFYFVSLLNKKLSMFMLMREILKKRGKSITLKIGDPIPAHHFTQNTLSARMQTRLLKRHVYRIGRDKEGIFKTEMTIIHPVDRKIIKSELARSQLLSAIADRKKLYLVNYENGMNVVKEISRLREITFRKVGEGTGLKSDFDKYDRYFKHVVLWDEEELDIIGSYRLGVGKEIIPGYGFDGFYNASLFSFSEAFHPYLQRSLELGRSFIQQKYWRTNALDQLWLGIASFLMQNPDIRYLFGGVSISDNYPLDAKALIVHFYKKWFGDSSNLVKANTQFQLSKQQEIDAAQILNNDDYEKDFFNMKNMLKNLGFIVPILFRRYSELCEMDGVKFLDFCVDPDFSSTVDGFVLLSLEKLKESKRKRYFSPSVEATGEHVGQSQK